MRYVHNDGRYSLTSPRAALLKLVLCATVAAFLIALAYAKPSYALFECAGTTPPSQKLPLDGKVINAGDLVEFTVEDTPGQPSNCMYIAVAKDPTRTPEGWYRYPIDRCHPVAKQYNGIFYSCVSENPDWRKTPGKYYWTTYKLNTECFPSACYNPNDWEITVAGPKPGVGPGGPVVIEKFSLSSRTLRRSKSIGINTTLNAASALEVQVDMKVKGRKAGKRCKKAKKRQRRGRPCTLYRKVGSLSYAAQAGDNSFTFNGKVGGKRLKRGSYRLTPSIKGPSGEKTTGKSAVLEVR